MRSHATILGHPIHPMLVGFPVTLYTATLGSLIAHAATGNGFWAEVAAWSCGGALLFAAVAALPGAIDYFFAVPRSGPARHTARLHAAANVIALGLFAACFALIALHGDGWLGGALALSGLGLATTVFAGFQGWSLVQDHHVGLREAAAQRAAAATMVATDHGERMIALDEGPAHDEDPARRVSEEGMRDHDGR